MSAYQHRLSQYPSHFVKLFWFSCLLVLFVQLSGCASIMPSSRRSKDGPPPFPVDMSQVKDCVPKPEPKSKYGNPSSYVVWGKRYYVMKSSRGYCECGTASWYGMAFHQRRTSSGERFDTTTMTAAHKTLPLPTYVQVTNLENGRQAIVKVNDRGPFHDDRIIDLSYVAAVKLGVYPKGTARVRVRAIDPYEWQHRCCHRARSKHCASTRRVQHGVRATHHADYATAGSFKSEQAAFRKAQQLQADRHVKTRVIKECTSQGSRYIVQYKK